MRGYMNPRSFTLARCRCGRNLAQGAYWVLTREETLHRVRRGLCSQCVVVWWCVDTDEAPWSQWRVEDFGPAMHPETFWALLRTGAHTVFFEVPSETEVFERSAALGARLITRRNGVSLDVRGLDQAWPQVPLIDASASDVAFPTFTTLLFDGLDTNSVLGWLVSEGGHLPKCWCCAAAASVLAARRDTATNMQAFRPSCVSHAEEEFAMARAQGVEPQSLPIDPHELRRAATRYAALEAARG